MTYYMISRRGGREVNEDFAEVYETASGYCCALADGLGGHEKGEVASRLAVRTAIELFGGQDVQEYLNRCFQEGQSRLLNMQKAQDASRDMKTTLTVLASLGGKVQWGHVGDSRLYYFKNGRLAGRTLDHSVPQMLASAGEIKEKEIRGHEDRNRLLRVMGSEWNGRGYELSPAMEQEGADAYLLCSDGFWEWIDEKKMAVHLKRSYTPREWIEGMEEEVLNNGRGKNLDNYTAIGVWNGEAHKRKKRLFWRKP